MHDRIFFESIILLLLKKNQGPAILNLLYIASIRLSKHTSATVGVGILSEYKRWNTAPVPTSRCILKTPLKSVHATESTLFS